MTMWTAIAFARPGAFQVDQLFSHDFPSDSHANPCKRASPAATGWFVNCSENQPVWGGGRGGNQSGGSRWGGVARYSWFV